jgi:hypothetical protein
VRPSAAAAGHRAGPVVAALRAAGPAAAHDKGPMTKNGSSQATGPHASLIMLLWCVRSGLLRS